MTLAVRIVQNTAASQLVNGIAKPLAATAPHHYLLALATLLCHWCHTAVSAEGSIISLG
jgi:hypothetical protein